MANEKTVEPFRLLDTGDEYEIRWHFKSPNSVSIGSLAEGLIFTGNDVHAELMLTLANTIGNLNIFHYGIKNSIKEHSGHSYNETLVKIQRGTKYFSKIFEESVIHAKAEKKDLGMDILEEVLKYRDIGYSALEYVGMVSSSKHYPKHAVHVLASPGRNNDKKVYIAQLFNNRMNIIRFSEKETEGIVQHMIQMYTE